MSLFASTLLGVSAAVVLYAYMGYPVALAVLGFFRRRKVEAIQPAEWPRVSITVPAHNEEGAIATTLDRLLELDYPPGRRQIVVISDASTDRTDEIVGRYASRGVELLRLAQRSGKTAAENAARAHLTGEIVVNADASVRLHPGSLKPLIAAFGDPTVGVASGRDVSVTTAPEEANLGESGYVGYEMWVRDLETSVDGIVGASGCFYASRIGLHMEIVPQALSRDFAAPLIARARGYRAVSVPAALCYVPRVGSLGHEYRRKVRTMTRGLETLYHWRALLNPLRYGWFAWMLFSHKLMRWLVPWAMLVAALACAALAPEFFWARAALVIAAVGVLLTSIVWWRGSRFPLPPIMTFPAYVILGLLAGVHSWINALRGELNPIWEPTRRL